MCVRAILPAKQTTLTFSAQNRPKMDLGLAIYSENYCQNKSQHPQDTMYANFQLKQSTLIFWPKFAQKGN